MELRLLLLFMHYPKGWNNNKKCLFVYLPIYLSIYLFGYLFGYLFVCVFVYLFACLYVYLCIYLYFGLFTHLRKLYQFRIAALIPHHVIFMIYDKAAVGDMHSAGKDRPSFCSYSIIQV